MEQGSPKISIVTPSMNQGRFLEETISSVVDQGYPNLEYIVVDGGSEDNSLEIIHKHEKELSYWESKPDEGQYHAIQRGFALTTGEIMAWINSDDKYTSWAFELVSDIFKTFPQVEWITTSYPLAWGEKTYPVSCHFAGGYNAKSFFSGGNLPGRSWHAGSFIQQESTFWRRSLWDRAGGRLDTSLKLAADFELWGRFFDHADLYGVDAPLAGFRMQPDQKTAQFKNAYLREAEMVLRKRGGRLPGRLESLLKTSLRAAVGKRSLRKTPPLLGRFLTFCGLLYPAKLLVYDEMKRSWKIVSDYFI